MEQGTKRKAVDGGDDSRDKRLKVRRCSSQFLVHSSEDPKTEVLQTKKQWRVPYKNDRGAVQAKAIQPGDSGIWATCNKGREGKCVGELRDFFTEYAELLYGGEADQTPDKHLDDAADDDQNAVDIESEITAEVAGIRKPAAMQLFTPVRLDVQCVVFFRTIAPVVPVSFVKRICEDATRKAAIKRTRFAKRLSPMTLMGRASVEGLEKVASEVLAPLFHGEPFEARKVRLSTRLESSHV